MQFKNCLIIFIQALLLQKIHSTIWNAEVWVAGVQPLEIEF